MIINGNKSLKIPKW